MSNLKWDIAAALVAFIITTSGFLVMVENAPTQSVNISKDQAIGIIKASSKVDPEKTIVKDEYLTSAELQYLNINWGSYLWSGGSHRRIYVSTTPVGGEFKPYWVLDYEQPLSHVSSSGTYVVDAETGELMLALEDSGGLPTLDFSMTLTPQATQDNPLIVKRGESSSINLTLFICPLKVIEYLPINYVCC